jgi:hypothetical protein
MQNGFIHFIFDALIKTGRFINLVEYFKKAAQLFYLLRSPDRKDDNAYLRKAANIGIDVFILLKWILVGVFWVINLQHVLVTIVVWYLLVSNIFTYFYYHTWNLAPNTPETTERSQRRFLNVLLSMGYSVFCYAYFYDVIYTSHFLWGEHSSPIDMLYFSTANALTVTYGDVSLLDTTARVLCASQLAITFIFVLIIASSIPVNNSKGN